MFHVIVMPLVSQALGQNIRDRNSLVRVLNCLYSQLENPAPHHRNRRSAQQPEDYFDYLLNLFNEEGWHTLRFFVNDQQATDYLFVDGVGYRAGKFRS